MFSHRTIRKFHCHLSTEHPASFPRDDMFLVVNQTPSVAYAEKVADTLGARPGVWLVQDPFHLDERLREAEAHRAAQLTVSDNLSAALTAYQAAAGVRPAAITKETPPEAGIGLPRPASTTSTVRSRARMPRRRPARGSRALRRVAVDLTPLLPGPDNGGVGLVARTVVSHLSRIAVDCEFVLLTSADNHAVLEALDGPNTRRVPVDTRPNTNPQRDMLPQLQALMRLLTALDVDLLFCPFHVPSFFDPRVPIVSVICDLQYRSYPQYFTAEQRCYRESQFRNACQLADRVICISDHTRQTVLKNCDLDSTRTVTIPASIFGRLRRPSSYVVEKVLRQYNLRPGRFLLYPANFWRHKNHRLLLAALALYQTQFPESDLMLVCTGAPGGEMDRLSDAAAALDLTDRTAFLGYVRGEDELPSLLASCLALVFPSLYEGFGIPILEAMAFGRPVLCSNVTSLPEIASDAALFFDPNKLLEITAAIVRLEQTPELARELARKGYERITAFPDPEGIARRYLQMFEEVVRSPRPISAQLHGVYADMWTSQRIVVTYPASTVERHLEVTLLVPDNSPYERVRVAVADAESQTWDRMEIVRGQPQSIRRLISHTKGFIELLVDPVFQPYAQSGTEDYRLLGCTCASARLVSADAAIDLLASGHLAPV